MQSTRKRTNEKIKTLAITASLVALILIMSFTPIGYLKIGVVSISFIPIPVVIGAIICNPTVGAILGGVFGITSLIQCFGMDAFGTALMSFSPLYTVIVCLVPRIAMGLLCGLMYKAMKKKNVKDIISFSVTSISGGILNTVLFVGLLILLFIKSETIQSFGNTIPAIIAAIVTINAPIEWISCLILGTAVSKALKRVL